MFVFSFLKTYFIDDSFVGQNVRSSVFRLLISHGTNENNHECLNVIFSSNSDRMHVAYFKENDYYVVYISSRFQLTREQEANGFITTLHPQTQASRQLI